MHRVSTGTLGSGAAVSLFAGACIRMYGYLLFHSHGGWHSRNVQSGMADRRCSYHGRRRSCGGGDHDERTVVYSGTDKCGQSLGRCGCRYGGGVCLLYSGTLCHSHFVRRVLVSRVIPGKIHTTHLPYRSPAGPEKCYSCMITQAGG